MLPHIELRWNSIKKKKEKKKRHPQILHIIYEMNQFNVYVARCFKFQLSTNGMLDESESEKKRPGTMSTMSSLAIQKKK